VITVAFNSSLATMFFNELKQYNRTNFMNLYTVDISKEDAAVIKAFSSVITRYFIFCEKHPEITDLDKRILYFRLNIDKIARFFANYPDTDLEDLVAFQAELKHYIKRNGDDADVEFAV
jgi:hypothetical protein